MSAGLIDRIRSLLESLLPADRAARIDNADVATSTRATPADVENRVAVALNTALPPAPTADSLFERIKSLDDNLPAARAAFMDAATSSRASPADVDAKLTAWLNTAIAANPVVGSVWERIKTLDDNYTATRAAYLDIIATALDATVGSRAPASTALSNATWTNTRAALIDRLDALVSSRATPADVTAARDAVNTNVDAVETALAALINQRATPSSQMTGIIKSIQTGYVANPARTIGQSYSEDYQYADVTVSSVVAAKCIVLVQPQLTDTTPSYPMMGTARLTSATNLRVQRGANAELRGRYMIVEFY